MQPFFALLALQSELQNGDINSKHGGEIKIEIVLQGHPLQIKGF